MLKSKLNELIDDLNNTQYIQRCLDNHFSKLDALMQRGYRRKQIYLFLSRELNFDLKESTFMSSLDKTRKKFHTKVVSKNAAALIVNLPKEKKLEKVEHDWDCIYFLQNSLLIEKLESAGYTPEDVLSWKVCSEMAIINKLSDIQSQKKKAKYR